MAEHYRSEGHYDRLLTNISQQARNVSYIADQIFPIVTVMKASDYIAKYNQSHWFRNGAALRAPRTASVGGGFSVTQDSYITERVSFRDEFSDDEQANYDNPFQLLTDSVDFVTDKMGLYRETQFATKFFAPSKGWYDRAGTTHFVKWSDVSTSNPMKDVGTYKDYVETQIAREPNKFVMGKEAYLTARWNVKVLDSIKYTQTGIVSKDLLASLFEFDDILIGRAIQTTDPEGTAEASVTYARVWGDRALMVYVPERPSLRVPAAGYTLVWQVVPNALQYIKRMRDEEREANIIEGNSYFVQKQTSGAAGALLDDIS